MTTTLVATDRPSLDRAHQDVGRWVRERLDRVTLELQESRRALTVARERKWGTSALARVVRQQEQHEQFLLKVLAAVNAGFAIVPNFQITRLAVRTDREPEGLLTSIEHLPRVGAARLPVGRGKYVSPEPEFESWEEERTRKGGDGKDIKFTVTIYSTTAHAPVDIPLTLMKTELADALHEAMEARLFDEIGIVYDGPKRDPVLVGRVIHPKGTADRWGAMSKGVTFFIAWWFQPSALDL
jgi:hypothetical protein